MEKETKQPKVLWPYISLILMSVATIISQFIIYQSNKSKVELIASYEEIIALHKDHEKELSKHISFLNGQIDVRDSTIESSYAIIGKYELMTKRQIRYLNTLNHVR